MQHCAQFFLGIWRAIVECAQQQTGLFLGLIVLSPVIFFLVRNLLQNCVQGVKNLFCPVVVVPAKVVSRRHVKIKNRWQKLTHNYRHVGPPFESIKSGGTLYFVTFQLEDGSQKELQVWQDIHHGLREGEYGLLTYRGDKFKSFQMSTMRAQQA